MRRVIKRTVTTVTTVTTITWSDVPEPASDAQSAEPEPPSSSDPEPPTSDQSPDSAKQTD